MNGRPVNCAILYHPDGYDANRPQVKGRHAAGAGFLKGFVDHSGVERFLCATEDESHFQQFRETVREMDASARPIDWVRPRRLSDMARAGCLYTPGPNLNDYAWFRRLDDERAYSLCGVTHTVASDSVIRGLGAFLTTPTQSWDALICTSQSVRVAVERAIEGHAEFLAARLGGQPKSPVQLPVIPLGVESDFYAQGDATDADRAMLRTRLGLSDNHVAGLFLGRLSFHAKAHPIPMFMAFERAQAILRANRDEQRELALILTGQFPNDAIAREFHVAARTHCPNVSVHVVDGADPELARASWFAADFFVSLSDNIQESFGLTPVEAMAAGLPCVVSDWDGYKDTVVDGETGFRAPTLTPSPGAAIDLADLYMAGGHNYDFHIGAIGQATAIDVDACAAAVARLAADDALRRRMSEAARRRARDVYDWRHVVTAYVGLWGDLAERRARDAILAPRDRERETASPSYPDPFAMFADHPTRLLGGSDRLVVIDDDARDRVIELLAAKSVNFVANKLLDQGAILSLLDRIGDGAVTSALTADTDRQNAHRVERTLVWLHKYGIISVT